MANFTSGDNIDWCWGSLRPWQILHSKLAERERRGSLLDVWELVDEMVGATTDLRGRDQEGDAHGLQFLGDDREFWRHGGVMEARIREWLARRDEEEEAVVSVKKLCSKESIISTSSAIAIAWATEDKYQYVEEEDEEENDDDEVEANYEESIEVNYDDYEDNYDDNEVIMESANIVAVNKCCMARAWAAPAQDEEEAETANMAATIATPPDLEEVQFDLCPVCLEKLLPNQALLPLACRHAFHTDCLSPWLQRQPHACCPCCRAPISSASLAAPPNVAVPVDLAAVRPTEYSCADDDNSGNIMGLLADVEAALERLGFRS